MSASDPLEVRLARTFATAGLGIASELMLSIPAWTFPALYSPCAVSGNDRLRIWSKLYSQGKKTMYGLIPPSVLALGFSAYAAKAPALPGANFVAQNRQARLFHSLFLVSCLAEPPHYSASWVSTGFTVSIVGFTKAVMEKFNQEQVQLATELTKGKDTASSSSPRAAESDELVRTTWLKWHITRTVFANVAFFLTVTELAFA
ncbi:hypothetical protein JCM10213_000441 [Rhodosporidiobolus nylandii]